MTTRLAQPSNYQANCTTNFIPHLLGDELDVRTARVQQFGDVVLRGVKRDAEGELGGGDDGGFEEPPCYGPEYAAAAAAAAAGVCGSGSGLLPPEDETRGDMKPKKLPMGGSSPPWDSGTNNQ